ncbi:MAG: hypothetical protein ACRCYU_02245, partial [Nocardioides sp.]
RPPAKKTGIPTHDVGVDAGFYRFLTLSFDTATDIERAFGRDLRASERDILTGGGALVIDNRAPTADNMVRLIDFDAPDRTFDLPARRSALSNPPISAGAGVVGLSAPAPNLGITESDGALIYTGIDPASARQVRTALADAGVHPETAWIYQKPDPIIPDFALIGSALALTLTLLLATWATIRAQVVAIRPWVSRLTHLGVKRSWGLRALLRQYALVVLIGAAAGLTAGVGPLVAAQLRLPNLTLDVPWREISALVFGMLIAMVLATVLAARSLSYHEGAESQVGT